MESPTCQGRYRIDVLSLTVSVLFFILLSIRLLSHRHAGTRVTAVKLRRMKLCASVALCLITFCTSFNIISGQGLLAPETLVAVFLLLSDMGLAWLFASSHKCSIKPSTTVVIYLLGSSCTVTLELTFPGNSTRILLGQPPRWLQFVNLLVRLTLFVLECHTNVNGDSLPCFDKFSPEEKSGVVGATFFWWVNNLLRKGYTHILQPEDIPRLDTKLASDALRVTMQRNWDLRKKPESPMTLAGALVQTVPEAFMSVVIPRLFVIIFRCSQPILMSETIRFISTPHTESDRLCGSYWILVAAIATYFGLAISSSVYQHRLNRLRIMLRASLITLVYNKTLNMSSDASSPGRAATLITTNLDGIIGAGEMFHETWAQLFELITGVIILASQVGWLWPVPLITISVCSRVSLYVARNIRHRQKEWNTATQNRISTLCTVLGSMKSLKCLGITTEIVRLISGHRQSEISKAKKVWWMNVAYNASANALGIFAPVITIVLYAIQEELRGSHLTAKTAFTTLATLAIVTHPANMIMTIVPRAVASRASFERIQEYLLLPSRSDQRQLNRPLVTDNPALTRSPGMILDNATVAVPGRLESYILRDLKLQISHGTITICCGPVGSGKSTLIKAVLGEIPLASGNVAVSSRHIGYCDQIPWLPPGSIRDIVCAFSNNIDEVKYQQALIACCLDYDLAYLPDGDATQIGSRGINLSGGQRQRLALARLLYSSCEIAILDDPFTAMDGMTESRVAENILGVDGWLRKSQTTVLLVTGSPQHCHRGDQVALLEGGRVQAAGSWAEMKDRVAQIRKFSFSTIPSKILTEDTSRTAQQLAKLQRNHDAKEDLYRNTGDLSLYSYYIRSAGIFNTLIVMGCTASYSFFITIPHYWIKWWSEEDVGSKLSVYYILVYTFFAVVAWASTSGTMCSAIRSLATQVSSSNNFQCSPKLLHCYRDWNHAKSVFRIILSMTLFINAGSRIQADWQPSFGQDIMLVDRHLPTAFSVFCNQVFKLAMQTLVLLRVQHLLIAFFPICAIALYFVQRIYLRTSRQLRCLELESQSGLLSSLIETVDGLVSIRAFQWQSVFHARSNNNLDLSLRPSYALFCVQRWLNLVLELIVSTIAISIVFFAVTQGGTTSGSELGVALNLILVANTTLVRLIESWTTLEVSLGAIARIRQLELDTPIEEDPAENITPDVSWPLRGELLVENVSVSHNSESVILKDISLHIPSGQKVIICGRTGSGKSTLLMALLRLANYSGTIKVDGQDLSSIPQSLVRRRCFVTVPQDPFFVHEATLRFNLDPSSSMSDDVLESVLQKVGLWSHLPAGELETGEGPLSETLSSLPSLSVGQSQLLALARAITQTYSLNSAGEFSECARRKPILLLDEATSSLDSETESFIYSLVESEFVRTGHTVIIVAHRLSALQDRIRPDKDIVALIERGAIGNIGLYKNMMKYFKEP